MKNKKSGIYFGDFSVKRITLALKGADAPGNIYSNYKNGRGLCGIVVPVNGGSTFEFSDGRSRYLSSGEIAVFSEKSEYSVVNTSDIPFEHYTINFTVHNGASLPFDEVYVKYNNVQSLAEKCDRIIMYRKTPEISGNMRAMSLLYDMLSEILSEHDIDVSTKDKRISVYPAVGYIEACFEKNITTDMLSRQCMMSNSSFRRIFKDSFGISPVEYLLDVRIKRATELIMQTSMSISEISLRCGFKDTEHFCRTYKKRTGMTASQVRKSKSEIIEKQ